MGTISAIISIITLIPRVKAWFDELVSVYVQMKIASMKRENREAIRRAIIEHDQRDLEKAIGNPYPGEPSGEEGTEIIDGPPIGG